MNQDEEIRKDVFAWFGSAAYAAQLFEVELVILLIGQARLADPNCSIEKLDDLDISLSKKTLGQLLNEMKKHFTVSKEFEEILIEYRDKRNYLAHHFFSKNGEKLLSISGCKEMTTELQEIYDSLREADKIVTKMSENVRTASGINEEDFQKYVSEQIKYIRA